MSENKSRIAAQIMVTISIFSAAAFRMFLERHDSVNALDTSIKWLGLAGIYLIIFTVILIRNSDSYYLRFFLYINLISSGIILIHLSYTYLTSTWSPFLQFMVGFLFFITSIANYIVLPGIILFLALENKN